MPNTDTPNVPASVLVKRQTKDYGPKIYREHGSKLRITAHVRFDDECGNGHNTFAITGTIDEYRNGRWCDYSGGCIHDEVAKHFPELAPFIKWHLAHTDEPMHYGANAIYHAGDKDYNGKRAGDPDRIETHLKINNCPITIEPDRRVMKWYLGLMKEQDTPMHCRPLIPADDLVISELAHDGSNGMSSLKGSKKYTIAGIPAKRWHDCPFDSKAEAEQWIEAFQTADIEVVEIVETYSEGKPRDLDAARRAAVWLDATDEQLTAPGLAERLRERLPAMMAEFKRDVESLGFVY